MAALHCFKRTLVSLRVPTLGPCIGQCFPSTFRFFPPIFRLCVCKPEPAYGPVDFAFTDNTESEASVTRHGVA